MTTSDMISMNDLGAPSLGEKTLFMSVGQATATNNDGGVKASWNELLRDDTSNNQVPLTKPSFDNLLKNDASAVQNVKQEVEEEKKNKKPLPANRKVSNASFGKERISKGSFRMNQSDDYQENEQISSKSGTADFFKINTQTQTQTYEAAGARSDTSSEHAPDYSDDSEDDGWSLTCW